MSGMIISIIIYLTLCNPEFSDGGKRATDMDRVSLRSTCNIDIPRHLFELSLKSNEHLPETLHLRVTSGHRSALDILMTFQF